MNKIPLTVSGAKQLRDELGNLKIKRIDISKAIGEAREHGDLKENAEYHAAKEEQGLCEARIRDIENKLANAQIIDVSKITNSGRVIFGVTVYLLNIEDDEELSYQIVGEDEADINLKKISVNSPIARGLIGKNLGDLANVVTPSGTVEYEIVKVDYK